MRIMIGALSCWQYKERRERCAQTWMQEGDKLDGTSPGEPAQHLHTIEHTIVRSVFLIGSVSDVRGDARINLEILGRLGLTVAEVADSQAWELHFSEFSACTLIVDAIFGTGLNAPVSGLIQSVIADVNASGVPVVSIDLPSGLSADSDEPIGDSIEAGMTVTIAAPKLPLVLPPAEIRAGDIVIKQGTEGDFSYVVVAGKCTVTRETPLNKEGIKLAELGHGDSFGEEALIAEAKRNATVTSKAQPPVPK